MHDTAIIAATPEQYRSPLQDWEYRASVRCRPRRSLQIEQEQGEVFFPPGLVSISRHPFVVARGQEVIHELLARHLVNYLLFTETLEHAVVNEITFEIARGRFHEVLPAQMRRDAWRIYVDEANHAGCSGELIEDVAALFRWQTVTRQSPSFIESLNTDLEPLSAGERLFLKSFFAFVSETLISSSLKQIPADKRVFSTVRQVVSDHALDEAKHHHYFADFLRRVWPSLSHKERLMVAPRFASFISYFLSPDRKAERRILVETGLSAEQAEQVVAESHTAEELATSLVEGSRATVSLLEECGAFQLAEVRDTFAEMGIR